MACGIGCTASDPDDGIGGDPSLNARRGPEPGPESPRMAASDGAMQECVTSWKLLN